MNERFAFDKEGGRSPGAPPSHASPSFREDAWRSGTPEHPDGVRPNHPTMLHALSEAARLDESTGFTILPDVDGRSEERLSFGELDDAARRFATGLAECGVEAGDRVLLVMLHPGEFLTAFFGTQYAGALPVPAYPPDGLGAGSGMKRLRHVATDAGTELCVTSKLLLALLGDLGFGSSPVRRMETVPALAAGREPWQDLDAEPSDLAFLQYTSGSTDRPKGVVLTHRNVVCNVHSIGQALQIRRGDAVASWCPLYHDMGLVGGPLFSTYWRVPLVSMSPIAFLRKPVRWLRAIHDHRATLSPAPNFGYALAVRRVAEEEREGLDLSCWRVALNGAEPVNPSTVEAFVDAYAAHGFDSSAMMPVYGLAEATVAVTFRPLGSGLGWEGLDREALARGRAVPAPDGLQVVSVGRPIPGQRVRVLDDVGNPLPERRIGFVQVAGPSVMARYHGDPEATEHVRDGEWLWTGDRGYLADGELYLTGRANDVIILHGRNYHAEDLERSAEKEDGVRGGCSVAFGVDDRERARERVVLICETYREGEEERAALERKLRLRVQEDTTVPVDEVLLVRPGTLPKSSSGKRQRERTRELYLADDLRPSRGKSARSGRARAALRSGLGLLKLWIRRLFPGEGGG